jgi:hypothetical protein
MLGMPMGPARAPVTSLSKDAVHKLRQVLESMGVLPG